jgi:c-di-GMP-binding flagellar brake protein YcgR
MARVHPRRYPRLSVRVLADYTSGQNWSRCVASTLGGGGLFLSNIESLEPGEGISVRFRPARHLPVIEAKANVRYKKAGQGTGVEFTDITDEDRVRLLRMIHKKSGDRRKHPRAPLATQVLCKEFFSLAYSRDLSLGGMFVETARPLSIGSPVKVRFNLDQKDLVVTAEAHVHYYLDKMGMGILFDGLSLEHQRAIEQYVETHQEMFTSATPTGSFST